MEYSLNSHNYLSSFSESFYKGLEFQIVTPKVTLRNIHPLSDIESIYVPTVFLTFWFWLLLLKLRKKLLRNLTQIMFSHFLIFHFKLLFIFIYLCYIFPCISVILIKEISLFSFCEVSVLFLFSDETKFCL